MSTRDQFAGGKSFASTQVLELKATSANEIIFFCCEWHKCTGTYKAPAHLFVFTHSYNSMFAKNAVFRPAHLQGSQVGFIVHIICIKMIKQLKVERTLEISAQLYIVLNDHLTVFCG